MSVQTALRIPEIVEHIISFLDDNSTKTCRKVCKLWNDEATKILIKRKALPPSKTLIPLNKIRCEFHALKMTKILKQSIHPEGLMNTLSINSYRMHFDYRTRRPILTSLRGLIKKYGYLIRTVNITDFLFHPMIFSNIFQGCCNLETLKIDFWTMTMQHQMSSSANPLLTLPFQNTKLKSFDFRFIFVSVCDMKYTVPHYIIHLFTSIILSSHSLSYLKVSSNFLCEFLDVLNNNEDSEFLNILKGLKTVAFHYDVKRGHTTHFEPVLYKEMVKEGILRFSSKLQACSFNSVFELCATWSH